MKRLSDIVFNTVLTLALLAVLAVFWFGINGKAADVVEVSAEGQVLYSAERCLDCHVAPLLAMTEEERSAGNDIAAVTAVECVVIRAPEPVELYAVPLDASLQEHMIGKAQEIGMDPAVLFAMARKESTYDPGAVGDNGNSLGLLQIQPRWNMARMERLGCMDLLDPFQNVTVAADLLGELMDKHGDLAVALTVYNNGHYPGYVTEYARTVMLWAEELR